MLKNIPAILSPELLKVLCEMGHGDTIVIADGNFPAASTAEAGGAKLVRCDGLGAPELLRAILEVFPLDSYVGEPVTLMGVAQGQEQIEVPIWGTFFSIAAEYDSRGRGAFRTVDRFAFYEEAKQAYAIAASGESAIYANVILQKGVV